MEGPFEDAFDMEKVRGDRMLHWLMRDSLVGLEEVQRLSENGVVLWGTRRMPCRYLEVRVRMRRLGMGWSLVSILQLEALMDVETSLRGGMVRGKETLAKAKGG